MNIRVRFILRLALLSFLSITIVVSCSRETDTPKPTLHKTVPLKTVVALSSTIIPIASTSTYTQIVALATNRPSHTVTKTTTHTQIPSATAIWKQLSLTPTPTTSYFSFYDSLPPGQYIIYYPGNGLISFGVVSVDGKFQSTLVTGVDVALGAFTQDGKRLAFSEIEHSNIVIYDLAEKSISKIRTPTQCYRVDFSPDNLQLVAECADGLRMISLENDQSTLISREGDSFIGNGQDPVWSPDGQLIAFYFWGNNQNDTRNGVYIMEAGCIKAPSTCSQSIKGPFLGPAMNIMDFSNMSHLAWSPDSQHLAILNYREDMIQVFDIQSGEISTILKQDSYQGLAGVVWSPDGNWLAFGVSAVKGELSFSIYMIAPQGGTPLLIRDDIGDVIDWITVPVH